MPGAAAVSIQVGDGTFYRIESGQLQHLGTDWRATTTEVARPEGVLLLEDVKRRSVIGARPQRLRQPLGRGRRRRLPRVPHQDEHHRSRRTLASDRAGLRDRAKGRGRLHQALVIYNEGSNFSVGANLGHRPCSPPMSPPGRCHRGHGRGGQQALKVLQATRPFPVVSARPRAWRSAAAARSVPQCDAIQAHAETYMGLVEVGVGLVPGWGGCNRAADAPPWSPNRGPQGPDAAGRQSVRDHRSWPRSPKSALPRRSPCCFLTRRTTASP